MYTNLRTTGHDWCMTFADCRLQTACSLTDIVFPFSLQRANHKQANLSDILIRAEQNTV